MTVNSPNPDVALMLDRPIWSALGSRHAHLAVDTGGVRRYGPGILPFIGFGDSGSAPDNAGEILEGAEQLITLQRPALPTPPGLQVVTRADAVQLVAVSTLPEVADERIAPLGEADLDEMLELAALTKPGPFGRGALALGPFVGIRIEGRLAAMAGQRWSQPGFTEVSGVCTHPDFQRRGLGRLLSCHVAGVIAARGDRPYLHAYASNVRAIELYRTIGFEIRAEMHVGVYAKA